MERMNRSAKRAALPQFDNEELMKIIDQFLLVDKRFIPQGEGYSLYLRPTLIGTTVGLGVTKPTKALLYVIASPVGPYFGKDFKPVSLEATEYAVRAWPKGYGEFKLGANYVSSIEPQTQAAAKGHNQNLWLFGEQGNITEVGAMNVFFVLKKGDKKELVTPPLNGTILPGVTRDSTLRLAREKLSADEWIISEREITIHEVKEKADNGELLEIFGTGTAAIVSPVNNIEFREQHIKVPTGDDFGPLTQQVLDWIKSIQYGQLEFEDWSRVAKKL
ncbi:aminotransferase [Scheffersomyces coipomensis]|uniref:aminotransferase n=1 Tax=Scheffersomyces coipomensis TaxID=1788519 RepID=UPI00315D26C6